MSNILDAGATCRGSYADRSRLWADRPCCTIDILVAIKVGDDRVEILGTRGRRNERCGKLHDLLAFGEDFDLADRVMAALKFLVERGGSANLHSRLSGVSA